MFRPPWSCGGSVFAKCVLCLPRGFVLGLWRLWRPCVPKACSMFVWWPCFGFLGALAALRSQGVSSGSVLAAFWSPGSLGGFAFPRCVLCLGGLCSLLAWWLCFGFLGALAALRSPGVFSGCAVALFWLPGGFGGSAFPWRVLCLRVALFWPPGSLGGLAFPRCVLCLRGGFVLASWEPWLPCLAFPRCVLWSLPGRLAFPRFVLCLRGSTSRNKKTRMPTQFYNFYKCENLRSQNYTHFHTRVRL